MVEDNGKVNTVEGGNRFSNVFKKVAESAKNVYHILVIESRVPSSYVEQNGNYYYNWADANAGKNRIQDSAILAAIKAKEVRKAQKGETHVNLSTPPDKVNANMETFSQN